MVLGDELTSFCQSDSLSEDGLCEIIIEKHGIIAPKNNDANINNYEFFHEACRNERSTEGILRYLLDNFPNAVRDDDEEGLLPLHIICSNKNVTLGMVQLLIDAFPESIRQADNTGRMPLHFLCLNNIMDDEVGLEILRLYLERCPESVSHAAEGGILPIHTAAAAQSPEFCHILIDAYPGSERITYGIGALPFHAACALNTVATVKYLYQLYPESINVATNDGCYPIHCAITRVVEEERIGPTIVVEITQFLLDCNPNVALQECNGILPFILFLIQWNENEDEIDENTSMRTCLKILQILYDANPDAIEDNEVTSNLGEFCEEVQTFLNSQLTYARQARDRTLMTTRDENGQLPLHRALRDNITLGSIKLLVKGNPSAISCNDNIGMIPLHVACQHHESPSVIEYLINLDPTSLHRKDLDDNTALHYACRGANHAIIALLSEKYGAISVSKRNAHNQLPIDLLFASREVSDRESVEYTESIFRLFRAYPATVMNFITNTNATSHSGANAKMSGKKRKIDKIH